jgi:hypothetical protein
MKRKEGMNEDPYTLLRKLDWIEQDGDPYDAAIAAFDPLMPDGLCSLLLDADPIIRGRGLFVFGELGRKGFVVLDAALKSVEDPRVNARSALMDGVMCYSKELTPSQAQIVLKLADDPEDLVREKVVAFLGAAVQDTIQSAIELFEEPLRSAYRRALAKLSAEPSQAQLLLDEGLAEISVTATFALAAIQRMARDGRLITAPQYSRDSYMGECVMLNTRRLMRRAARNGCRNW